MRKTPIVTAMVAVCSLLIAYDASALAINDDYYLGSYAPGQPAGDDHEEMNVQHLVDLWNGTTSSTSFNGRTFVETTDGSAIPGTAPDAEYLDRNETSGNTSVDVTGITYIIAKYMNEIAHVWYVAGLSGDVTVPGSDVQQGISHITRLTGDGDVPGVPDGGATAAMLGLGAVGLAWARHRRR